MQMRSEVGIVHRWPHKRWREHLLPQLDPQQAVAPSVSNSDASFKTCPLSFFKVGWDIP